MEDFLWNILKSLGIVVVLIIICAVAVVFVQEHIRERKYRKHIPDAIEILTVMSTERWDTRKELGQLINTKSKELIIYSFSDPSVADFPFYRLISFAPFSFSADLADLLDEGYIEEKTKEDGTDIYRKTTKRGPPRHSNVKGSLEEFPDGRLATG